MNNIKTKFSIRDLENLSGIKAHTIRIWEKRYNLFQPNRTDTNIRYYSLPSLQKLLNIAFLNKNGYKVSKIAQLKSEEIPILVKEIAISNDSNNHSVNLLKMAMLNFDKALFLNTFNNLIESNSLSDIFYNVFVPLLEDIGLLWQTDTITPAHEHFIFELIKQKILIHTDKIINSSQVKSDNKVYVLFLPDNEIHELGLLFINYELSARGFHCIYLGQSVPIDSLKYLTDYYKNIIYISSFTIKPEKEIIDDYLNEFSTEVLTNSNYSLFISGRQTNHIDISKIGKNISIFKTIKDILESLDNYKQQAV